MLSRFHLGLIPERNGRTEGQMVRQICYINSRVKQNHENLTEECDFD